MGWEHSLESYQRSTKTALPSNVVCTAAALFLPLPTHPKTPHPTLQAGRHKMRSCRSCCTWCTSCMTWASKSLHHRRWVHCYSPLSHCKGHFHDFERRMILQSMCEALLLLCSCTRSRVPRGCVRRSPSKLCSRLRLRQAAPLTNQHSPRPRPLNTAPSTLPFMPNRSYTESMQQAALSLGMLPPATPFHTPLQRDLPLPCLPHRSFTSQCSRLRSL